MRIVLGSLSLGGLVPGESSSAVSGESLLQERCDTDERTGTTPLMRAAFAGDPAEVAALLEAGADPNFRCGSGEGTTAVLMVFAPLFGASFSSDEALARIPYPLPEGLGGERDLRAREQSLSLLLRHGADPDLNERGTYPLTAAVILDQVWAVERLLAWGADPDRVPDLRRIAAMVGNPEVERLLGFR